MFNVNRHTLVIENSGAIFTLPCTTRNVVLVVGQHRRV